MSGLRVSVIICCYTLERIIDVLQAVESVLHQNRRADQIIVAVDHNTELLDKLKHELPSSVLMVLNNCIRGLSETRNLGIRSSTGDILAFIDDDAVAAPDWLENLVKPFSDPNVVAVGGKALPMWSSGDRPLGFPEELDWVVGCTYKGMSTNGSIVRNVIGCNMAFRKEVFDKIGYFNPKLGRTGKIQGANEETELCLRISQHIPNAFIAYEPKAIIHHKVPSWRVTTRYILQRSYDEGLNKARVRRQLSSFNDSKSSLSTESNYLKYLIMRSIPGRLTLIHKKGAVLETGAILASVFSASVGFLVGNLHK